MTGHQINSLVGDLVAMAQAMERLPQVESEASDLRSQLSQHQSTIQRLELKLMDRSSELDALNQRIRSLEVERDEAQFHALEADDRTSRALDFIKATFGNAGSLIQALEPPVPQPEVKPEPMPEPQVTDPFQPQGESASPLPNATTDGHITGDQASQPVITATQSSTNPAPEVAAQPDPSQAVVGSDASGQTLADTKADAFAEYSSGDQSFSMPAQAKPFEGRRYSDVVKAGNYPNRDEWEAGGGTVDNWYA